MLLAIDVGNTNIVYGLFEGAHLAHQFRVESSRGRTGDEYAVVLRQLLDMNAVAHDAVHAAIVASVVPPLTEPMVQLVRRAFGREALVVGPGIRTGMSVLYENPREVGADRIVNAVAHDAVHAAIVASVVPPLTEPMVQLVRRAFGREALVVGPGIRTGMSVLYENPREVGADRIVNAVAAFERIKGGVIVVDFGTATTFDCVTPKGEYLGGVIAPGVQISADALFARAAKLPRVDITKPAKVVGRNTVNSMQSGLVYGYVGLVDGIVERIRAELDYPCAVIATGGLATLIAPLSRTIAEVDGELTLTGLRLIHERNVAP